MWSSSVLQLPGWSCSSSSSRARAPRQQQQQQQQSLQQQQPLRRHVCAQAKRGRPRKDSSQPASPVPPEPAPAAAPAAAAKKQRKSRKSASADQQQPPAPTAAAAAADHERVISYEMDITSSVELDYTDNPTLVVPSYTHQAQGHESASQPPLDNFAADGGWGGSWEQQQQQAGVGGLQPQQQASPFAAAAQPPFLQQQAAAVPPGVMAQPNLQMGPLASTSTLQDDGSGSLDMLAAGEQQQLLQEGEGAGAAAGDADELDEDEDEDELLEEEPPGLFDYEAGLPFANTQPVIEAPLSALPARVLPRTQQQADYLLRYINWVGSQAARDREEAYKERALQYHLAARKESENVYLTGKAFSIVQAEVELEDVATGNRVDSFYPVWARAEHRWYPSGRFHAYNEYVKDNLAELTMKYAPGADQEEDFDIMDDVLLMDPTSPDGASDDSASEDGSSAGPDAGLSLDAFMGAGLLPGAGASELAAGFADEVLLGGGAGGGGVGGGLAEELLMEEGP